MTNHISRVAALDATKAGREAAEAGKSVSDCPHKGDDDLAVEFARHHWLKGFRLASNA